MFHGNGCVRLSCDVMLDVETKGEQTDNVDLDTIQ